jgi:integrase
MGGKMSVRRIVTKEGETKWEVSIWADGRKSKRLRRRFKKRQDAEDFVHGLKSRKQEITKSGTGGKDFEETTFREEAEYWVSIQSSNFSPGYRKKIKGVLDELLPKYGSLPPNRFHPGFLTIIQSEQLSTKISPATVNRKLEIVRAILNFAAKKRRIPSNPTLGYEKLREERGDIQYWERHEAEGFLAFTNDKYPQNDPNRWIYVVYLLSLNTSLRAGEIWGLQPRDLIQGGELIHIQRQYDRVQKAFRQTKGRKMRKVPCNQSLFDELAKIIQKHDLKSDEVLLFRERGKPICHEDLVDRFFNRDVKEWGGKRIRFHDLRHSGISLMIASGLDIRTVQEIGGHTDIKTTMNYAHLLAERIRHAARTFSIQPSEEKRAEQKPVLRLISNRGRTL